MSPSVFDLVTVSDTLNIIDLDVIRIRRLHFYHFSTYVHRARAVTGFWIEGPNGKNEKQENSAQKAYLSILKKRLTPDSLRETPQCGHFPPVLRPILHSGHEISAIITS
jgi:hypothetical protein